MEKETYATALAKKDGQLVLRLFDTKLKSFLESAQLIYDEFCQTPDYDFKSKNHLRHKYTKNWMSFVEDKVPFQLMLEVKDETINIKLSDVMRGDMLEGFDKKLNEDVINAIIKYSAFILQRNNLLYEQMLIWQVLTLVAKKFDLSSMMILPDFIVERCKQIMVEVVRGEGTPPEAMLHLNKLYNHRLSSSEKVGKYREEKIGAFLEQYCYKFKEDNGRYPLRKELRVVLKNFCNESNDPRLAVFKKPNSISEKTLTKFIKGFNTMRQNKKIKTLPKMNETYNDSNKMNLLEMYQHLNEKEKQIFKEAINE